MSSQKKRAVFLVTNDLTYDQRLQKKCSTLSELFDVVLVGRIRDNSVPISQENLFTSRRLKCFFNKGFLFYFEFNIRLFLFLLANKPDVVCANDTDTLLAAALYRSLSRNTHLTYDSHELFYEVPELLDKPFVRWVWKSVEQLFIPKVDVAYTVNQSLSKILRERYQKSFAVIRNLPYQKNGEQFIENRDKIILYQGALNKGRCLELLIDTMPLLPSFKLWLAGDGDLKEELEAQAKNSSAKNRITFLGKLHPSELAKVTQQAMLGYNLLEGDSLNYYYSLANKFFDFMMAEVPSINNDFPEYKNLCSKYEIGILIERLDKNHLAEKIQSLAENENQLRHMIDQAKKAKKSLTWENESLKLKQLYQKFT